MGRAQPSFDARMHFAFQDLVRAEPCKQGEFSDCVAELKTLYEKARNIEGDVGKIRHSSDLVRFVLGPDQESLLAEWQEATEGDEMPGFDTLVAGRLTAFKNSRNNLVKRLSLTPLVWVDKPMSDASYCTERDARMLEVLTGCMASDASVLPDLRSLVLGSRWHMVRGDTGKKMSDLPGESKHGVSPAARMLTSGLNEGSQRGFSMCQTFDGIGGVSVQVEQLPPSATFHCDVRSIPSITLTSPQRSRSHLTFYIWAPLSDKESSNECDGFSEMVRKLKSHGPVTVTTFFRTNMGWSSYGIAMLLQSDWGLRESGEEHLFEEDSLMSDGNTYKDYPPCKECGGTFTRNPVTAY